MWDGFWPTFFIQILLQHIAEVRKKNVVWTLGTFDYNFVKLHEFKNYLKKSCEIGSNGHFSFKYLAKLENIAEDGIHLVYLSGWFCSLQAWMGWVAFLFVLKLWL